MSRILALLAVRSPLTYNAQAQGTLCPFANRIASYADVLTGSSRNHSSPRTSASTSIHFRSGELANHRPFAIFCKMGL